MKTIFESESTPKQDGFRMPGEYGAARADLDAVAPSR